jgi:alpha-tubulin suppressor-like RCC1 family protein
MKNLSLCVRVAGGHSAIWSRWFSLLVKASFVRRFLAGVTVLFLCIGGAAFAQVATPVFAPSQPGSGVFSPSEGASQFNVYVTCATSGATIRYTTNGSEPTTSSATIANGGAIVINHNLTLKSKAWVGATPSATASATYHLGHAVAAGAFHTMAADFTGQLKTWGKENDLRLGHLVTPFSVPHVAMSSGVIDIDGGADDAASPPRAHSILLKEDGTVWCVGSNANGRLGNNSTSDPLTWVQTLTWNGSANVPLTDIRAVAAGNSSSYALSYDGFVYAWGRNQPSAPRIGIGSTSDINVLVATKVKTNSTTFLDRIVAIAAGDGFAIALRDDGTVWAWGGNTLGQIGDNGGASAHREYAVQVNAGATNPGSPGSPLTGITAIAAGGSHSIAVTSSGLAVGWGEAAQGRLGNGYVSTTSKPKRRPVYVEESGTDPQFNNVRKVAAGGAVTLLINTSGQLWACGGNGQHQLGDGTTTIRGYPVRVLQSAGVPLTPNTSETATIVDAAMGVQHGVALASSGKIYTWGFDTSGQLGDGTASSTDTAYATNSVLHPLLAPLAGHWLG